MDRSINLPAQPSAPDGRPLRSVPAGAAMPMGQVIDVPGNGHVDASAFVDTLYDGRYLIATITVVAVLAGVGYAIFAPPVYESNILIQVEDNSNSATDLVTTVSQMFDIKTAASDEIDVLNSRLVLGTAVEQTRMYIQAAPKRFPIVGTWWAGRHTGLYTPGIFGHGGYLWGQETIDVPQFDTPSDLYGKPLRITALGGGRYALDAPKFHVHAIGQVGTQLTTQSDVGPLTLTVSQLDSAPGGQFGLKRNSVVATTNALQKALKITQSNKDSDVIEAKLQGNDAARTSAVLTAVGEQYIHQNIARKSAEAERSIAFLKAHLPAVKQKLEQAEADYNAFRTRNASLDLSEEGSAVLQQSVDAQNKLADLEQQREELSARFTEQHPAVKAIIDQETVLRERLGSIDSKTRQLPDLEQTELRLQREVQVNSDLYTSLLNSEQQLQLASAGKAGNARLVDTAQVAELPVKPNRKLVVILAALVGIFGGSLIAWIRSQMHKSIVHAREIEDMGLPVYAIVPYSKQQRASDARRWSSKRAQNVQVLAHVRSDSLPVESLRNFRTALQFVMLNAPNNIVVMTGATPGVGKTFTTANLATVLAASNKRVLVVDADMRKGDLSRHFGLSRTPGLADMIGSEMLADEVVRRDVLPRLDVVTCGATPAQPSELLSSARFSRFLEGAAEQYDVVLIDTPPVLAVSDAAAIGHQAGSLFLVTQQGETTYGQIKETVKRLNHVGVPVNGVVLNGVRARPGDKLYGYGQYSYASPHARARA
ncbi:polysaccharide biosynthesis tyrosine autokinase [Pararobbsia silviterrae]|uniref:Putative tyrosine-protein kinase EpsB n=1 Tax=Pararobbsia silviterrae TaxID=1792498 RepID=A0A494YFK6_9BURK|nr:polysaccharide biosynthesis tyrosine autokinase [Pararobbsia silviterrae]RKP59143.1 polysaccharide biosynthesis tyrosine autokinase [Pararobbsia silviterrae]